MTNLRKFGQTSLVEIVLILMIAAVTYLPHLSQATVYRDDWYYIMDRQIGGPGTYQEMFSIDRPARGPLFEAYYRLFGARPFPYHMSSFLWRVMGGLAALWLFRQLWPGQRLAVFMMALLFTLYPGYLRWMEGFENQPRILSSFLETLSIALTLQAVRTARPLPRIFAWIGSILTGWAYIALLDFSFGMEVFRWLCVFVLVQREQAPFSCIRKGILATRAWAVAALIPAGFLFWRFFLFQNERSATDVGLQLGHLFSSPLLTGAWWLARLFQSVVNAAILAWGAPLFQGLFNHSLFEIGMGLLFAGLAAILFLLASFAMVKPDDGETIALDSLSSGRWPLEAIWLGLTGVLAGVLPIVVANRYVSFGGYSHYALPASLASVILVVGIVSLIHSRQVRFGVVAGLVFLAVLTHYTISLQILREERTIAKFWQQIVWRVPGIKAGTALVVNYPSSSYAEDVDAVAGPANFLYFPEQTGQIPAVYPLVALPQMSYTTKDVLGGGRRSYGYRTHVGEIDYSTILVISQSAANTCVRVIDSHWPRYSDQDPDQILLLGQYSDIQSILVEANAPRPPEALFGPEPDHTWCYYYQQAELALQERDWEKIVQLGGQVTQLKLTPNDRIEWAPFLQAYAFMGDEEEFKAAAIKMDVSPFVRREACRSLLRMQETGVTFTSRIQSMMDERLCRGWEPLTP